MFGDLERNVVRWSLDWSVLMVGWMLVGILARGSLASGLGYRKGLCVFWFWGMVQGLRGVEKIGGLG